MLLNLGHGADIFGWNDPLCIILHFYIMTMHAGFHFEKMISSGGLRFESVIANKNL